MFRFCRNASESPFLRLPPELRNRIYGFVFAGTADGGESSCWGRPQKRKKVHVRFLQTCRQVHTEARLLPFALNSFRYCSSGCLYGWSKSRPEHTAVIRTLHVSARDRNGKVKWVQQLPRDHDMFPNIRLVEFSLDEKRLPQRLYKELQKRFPNLRIKVVDEKQTQRRSRKQH